MRAGRDLALLDAPLASAELVAVDTETNGLSGEDCELTEIGAVLVGGGELHDRLSSLCRCRAPLRRGIQRLTGITQAMVDAAPEPEVVLRRLADMLAGRVMVAHNAPFDLRVLRLAFARAGMEWPDPPVLCTAAMARALLPLQRRRGLAVLADALGIEVRGVHRALADAETCGRVLCALMPRLCAHAGTVGEAVALLSPRRRRARPPAGSAAQPWPPAPRRAPRERLPAPRFDELPRDPGVYLFRDAAGAGCAVEGACARGGLPRDGLRAWRARARESADQGAAPAGQPAADAPRRPAGLHPLPPGHRLSGAGGGQRARRRPRGQHRAAAQPCACPRAGRAAGVALSPAPLRAAPVAPDASVGLRPDGALPVPVPGRP